MAVATLALLGVAHAAVSGNAPSPIPLGPWVRNMDSRCKLRYDINWMTQDLDERGQPRVYDLLKLDGRRPADGVYMYVYRDDGRFYIRPNDRGTRGVAVKKGSVQVSGDPKFLPAFNPDGRSAGCDWRPEGDVRHMYARHSQLANGHAVYSAGMLQFGNGALLWISNESGHYNPQISAVVFAVKKLRAAGVASQSAAVCEMPDKAGHRNSSGRGKRGSDRCPQGGELLPSW